MVSSRGIRDLTPSEPVRSAATPDNRYGQGEVVGTDGLRSGGHRPKDSDMFSPDRIAAFFTGLGVALLIMLIVLAFVHVSKPRDVFGDIQYEILSSDELGVTDCASTMFGDMFVWKCIITNNAYEPRRYICCIEFISKEGFMLYKASIDSNDEYGDLGAGLSQAVQQSELSPFPKGAKVSKAIVSVEAYYTDAQMKVRRESTAVTTHTPSPSIVPTSTPSEDKSDDLARNAYIARWKQLKIGMSMETVKAIIGAPESINDYTYSQTWNYKKTKWNFARPTVWFENGVVRGWEPYLNDY